MIPSSKFRNVLRKNKAKIINFFKKRKKLNICALKHALKWASLRELFLKRHDFTCFRRQRIIGIKNRKFVVFSLLFSSYFYHRSRIKMVESLISGRFFSTLNSTRTSLKLKYWVCQVFWNEFFKIDNAIFCTGLLLFTSSLWCNSGQKRPHRNIKKTHTIWCFFISVKKTFFREKLFAKQVKWNRQFSSSNLAKGPD